jgi:hypothetical protein
MAFKSRDVNNRWDAARAGHQQQEHRQQQHGYRNSKDANKNWNARNSRDADEVGLLADSYSSDASNSSAQQQKQQGHVHASNEIQPLTVISNGYLFQ